MKQIADNLAAKLQLLTPEEIVEVENFVEQLRHGGEEHMLSELKRSAAVVSLPAFEAVWNNPEDDVYDAL